MNIHERTPSKFSGFHETFVFGFSSLDSLTEPSRSGLRLQLKQKGPSHDPELQIRIVLFGLTFSHTLYVPTSLTGSPFATSVCRDPRHILVCAPDLGFGRTFLRIILFFVFDSKRVIEGGRIYHYGRGFGTWFLTGKTSLHSLTLQ